MTPLIEPESAAEAQFLSTIDSCVFPSASTSAAFSVDRPVTVSCLPLPSHLGIIAREHLESVESLVQVAWALILRQYLGGRTACFGYVANQDNYSSLCGASVTEHISLQRLDGVFAALDPDATLTVTLGNWHRAYTCRRIKSSHLVEIDQALVFNTALVVGNGILVGGRSRFNPTPEFPIVAFIDLSATIPQLAISCQPGAVPPEQQSLLAHAFQSAISAFLLSPKQKVRDLNVFTVWDHQRIATWNGHGLVAVNSCVHSEFSKIARRMGQAPAICSWDGHVSYEELDRLSSVLAATLKSKGIEPESVVALRFNKSLWAVVSMLAILKAGGAFVSLDPSQPDQRQKTIFEDANAALLLMPEVPSTEIPLWATERFYMVSEASTRGSFTQDDHGLAPVIGVESVRPQHAAYIAYTSGSTGKPKGIIVENSALSTSVQEQAKAMDIGPDSRVLQFAAYTFDVSVGDIFTTLTQGACLCIPDEASRRDNLAKAITDMAVTHACLTSTVAGFLDPVDVPTLQTLTLGGEPLSKQNITKWAGKVRLNNIYGPAECTVWCFVQQDIKPYDNESRFGHGIGARGWIVDPNDSDRLLPVGAVGELLVEGPLLARGYLNNPEQTAASFITDPAWLHMFGTVGKRRLYKTGDLVRYDPTDGAMIFVGRKDTQVKLRGQRIELGEIEHHLRLSLSTGNAAANDVVVDLFKPSSLGDAVLVAYVSIGASFPSHPNKTSMIPEVKECISAIADVSKKALVQVLPSYMIPTVFVPVQHIPLSTSGKTDIRTLRQICSSLSWAELLEISSGSLRTAHRKGESGFASKTEAESHMADAWATLLGISPDQIEPSDSFISLGGNSLMAIHLVAVYRERGLSLTVADILQHPELSAMTACTVPIRTATSAIPNPAEFSDMVTGQVSKKALFADAAQQCGVGSEDIVAVYPCTPLQVEMMDLSLTGKTSQFAHELSRLWPTLDFSRFKNAWEEIVKMHPILRTRFIRSSHDGELKQVIVDEPMWWEAPRDFDDYMATNFPTATTKLGDRLARWSLYEEPVESTSQVTNHMLIISLHHAIFDGVVLHHIFTNLFAIYTGNNLSHSPPNFGEYLWRTSKDLKDNLHDHVLYWGKYLAGWEQAGEFPPTVEPRDRQVHATGGTMRFLPFPGGVRPELGSLTLSTFLRGVWAILLARRTASECVVFSTFLAGRTVDMEGIERLVAPTFTHVPILARLSASQTVREFLAALQADAIAMMPYEATGMPRILQQACQSGSNPQLGGYMSRNLLVVQPMPKGGGTLPAAEENGQPLPFPGEILCGPRIDPAAMGAFNPFPLLMEMTMLDEGVAFRVSFDLEIMSAKLVEEMLDELTSVIQTLPGQLDHLLSGVV
ncbi:AMP-dependent synthetase/ligase [Apiospora arundinis]